MSDIGTDGLRLYTSHIPTTVVNGVVQPEPYVLVGGLRTPLAPARLMGDRLAVNPNGDVAVCARTAADHAYGSINFGPWVDLGRTAQPVCVWWVDSRFVFAIVGPGGGSVVEQEIVGGQVFPIKATLIPGGTSTGLLYYDEGSREFVVTTQKPIQVNGHTLYRAVRRLVDGRWIYHGQHVSYPKDVLYVAGEGVGFVSGPQKEIPQLIAIGSTLYTNGGAAWPPPYQSNVPTPQPPPIPVIGRPMWCAPFVFVPLTDAPLGNSQLLQVSTWQWKLMAGSKQVAVYVSGEPDGNLTSLEANIQKVKNQGVPVIAYWTRKLQLGRVPRGADIVGVEAYRGATETVSDYEQRVIASVRRCNRVQLVGQAYSSNPGNTSELSTIPPVIARIARDESNVEIVSPFSDGEGRKTGLHDHPAIRQQWKTLASGIPSRPPIPEPPDPEPPDPPDPEEPVAFPTDAEFADFYNRLNGKYAGPDMNRPPINPPSHVDPIGQGRWSYDYSVNRQQGNSHEVAWAKVEAEINRILGIPPNP